MSHKTSGTIYRTPAGKYVRTYQVSTHIGYRTHVQETPDISCATVFRGALDDRKHIDIARKSFGELTPLEVEVTRTVSIVGGN